MTIQRRMSVLFGAAVLVTLGCAPEESRGAGEETAPPPGQVYTVRDTVVEATIEAAAVAEPYQRATVSTKLMGTVLEVRRHEGEAVRAGDVLVSIDGRDLEARGAQAAASLGEAEAVRRDALTQAGRIRALYADSAATRAQLDAAETALVRADAGVRGAQSASAELDAMRAYAAVRAPFDGIITRRYVDPGAFATPGSPMLTVEDARRLRVSAHVAPVNARGLQRGHRVQVMIEDRPATAVVEGVVPAAGNLYTVNAIVDNQSGAFLTGSAARVLIPLGTRPALMIPSAAVRREGELTGVTLRTDAGDETRWVRVTRVVGDLVEVGAGIRAGDRLVLPDGPSAAVVAPRGR